jgi:hypothetical protein
VPNGHEDDDPNTPVEALAVIGKRVWETRELQKKTLQTVADMHETVKALRTDVANLQARYDAGMSPKNVSALVWSARVLAACAVLALIKWVMK